MAEYYVKSLLSCNTIEELNSEYQRLQYGCETLEFLDAIDRTYKKRYAGLFRNSKSVSDFEQTYCMNCGSQRCDGIYSEWFDGCIHKEELTKI